MLKIISRLFLYTNKNTLTLDYNTPDHDGIIFKHPAVAAFNN